MNKVVQHFEELLEPAGIKINGQDPWDIHVHNNALFSRVARDGTLGLGEAYMDGWWDCEALDEMITRGFRAGIEDQIKNNLRFIVYLVGFRLTNRQSRGRAFQVGEKHYDIGNNIFEKMLDPYMNYSCGFWESAKNLTEAQEAKMDMICKKLQLQPGMSVLDIGCGWGGLARWMTQYYGVSVTGITVSKEQAHFAKERCVDLPINIKVIDYRDLEGQYDRIVSVGMFEHVGPKNYKTFFKKSKDLLRPDGLFLLHTIGSGRSRFSTDRWIEKYIFPNGVLPPAADLAKLASEFFVIEDWHNFGSDYDPTLMSWYRNFNQSWPNLKEHYSERFKRMFNYYLLVCAGSFRSRENHLWQLMLSPEGVSGGYRTPRFIVD